jgi:hypothetical protein
MTDSVVVKINTPDEVDSEKLSELLNEPYLIMPDTTVGVTYCLVCGSEVPLGWNDSYIKICDDCKKAIMFIKEHFRYDEV